MKKLIPPTSVPSKNFLLFMLLGLVEEVTYYYLESYIGPPGQVSSYIYFHPIPSILSQSTRCFQYLHIVRSWV